MSAEAKITRRPDMRGGVPAIDGTRITVTDVVRAYRMYLPQLAAGYEGPPHPEHGFRIRLADIASELRYHFQNLSEDQVAAALTYWHEHPMEIQEELDEEDIAAIKARRKYARPL